MAVIWFTFQGGHLNCVSGRSSELCFHAGLLVCVPQDGHLVYVPSRNQIHFFISFLSESDPLSSFFCGALIFGQMYSHLRERYIQAVSIKNLVRLFVQIERNRPVILRQCPDPQHEIN